MGNAILVGFIGTFLELCASYGLAQFSNVIRELLSRQTVVDAITGAASGWICDYAKIHWGIVLNPVEPLTRPSISSGISQKLGIQLTDVFNKEALLTDIGSWLALELNNRYGTQFTGLYPLTNLQEQLENEILDLILGAIDDVESEVRGLRHE